jgi:hypothetical protein
VSDAYVPQAQADGERAGAGSGSASASTVYISHATPSASFTQNLFA